MKEGILKESDIFFVNRKRIFKIFLPILIISAKFINNITFKIFEKKLCERFEKAIFFLMLKTLRQN